MTLDHVDVVIVGAGLSGIGAACHLHDESPGKSYAILETRDAIGGTWDLFRYPGVRSDSDMLTLGYSFRPWTGTRVMADGESIRRYVRDTARQYGVEDKIRFRHRVVAADWSSADARWTVLAERTDTGETVRMTCSFLFLCSGYYRYDQGYAPHFEGADRFAGRIVHPQHWPEDLDYTDKRVAVIGSGATAVTIVPAMSDRARHVTMVQRSPGYIISLPAVDRLAERASRLLPPKIVYSLARWRNVLATMASFELSRRRPKMMRAVLRHGVRRQLPDGFDVATHFTPKYQPWDQRLCVVPDGDLFEAISRGKASVVTDHIETFTENGIRFTSGKEIEADLIVTATGLNLLPMGGLRLSVDGDEVDLPNTVAYKSMMLSGVPNFAFTVGYTNASWTLKADLVAHYLCRLLNHMDRRGYDVATPVVPDFAASGRLDPLIDLASGYVLRSIDLLPRQGPKTPWRAHQNYLRDLPLMRRGQIDDGCVRFGSATRKTNDEDIAAV